MRVDVRHREPRFFEHARVPAKYSPRDRGGNAICFPRGVPAGHATLIDRLLRPIHRWIWRDTNRRVRKLLAFAEVESGGGRDILRAAETTPDPLLRRLYLEH